MTKEEKREYDRKRYQANREIIAAQQAEYYQANKEKVLERQAEYYQVNKEKIAARIAEYRKENKERIAVQKAEYYATPIGRATHLLGGYKRLDKKNNRGECTLTAKWIVENIFSKPCYYCGETDWRKIGCDRIYNDKPHTMDNVVPCCTECNTKRGRMEFNKFVELIQNEGKA